MQTKMYQPRTEKGKFDRAYSEPRGKAIALRLPESIDKKARLIAGDNLTDFIRDAVSEKVAKEELQESA